MEIDISEVEEQNHNHIFTGSQVTTVGNDLRPPPS